MSDIRKMKPAETVSRIMKRIYDLGYTTTTGGNISMLDEKGNLWITPSAKDKSSLVPADICCITKEGKIKGTLKPSSEYTFHKAIYEKRPDIKAIIHAHPPALVSFSIIRSVPETTIHPKAFQVCGKTEYATYELPGSEELGKVIADEFTKDRSLCVIMENHGLVLGGNDMFDAFSRFEALETTAQTLINAKNIGNSNYLNELQIKELQSDISKGLPVTSFPKKEKQLRQQLCNIAKRACNQKLVAGAFGTYSVRLNEKEVLVTPANAVMWELRPSEIIKIQCDKEPETKELQLLRKIYDTNRTINAVIVSQPVNLMAFAITGNKFDVRTIPESWIFLQDIQTIDYETGPDKIASLLNRKNPAVLVSNKAFIVTGDNLLQTFDRLEIAEFSAKSIIMGTPLGDMVPMNDEQVEALRIKFKDIIG